MYGTSMDLRPDTEIDLDRVSLLVRCPVCKWSQVLDFRAVGGWLTPEISPQDPKWAWTDERLLHKPCGCAVRVLRFEKRRRIHV